MFYSVEITRHLNMSFLVGTTTFSGRMITFPAKLVHTYFLVLNSLQRCEKNRPSLDDRPLLTIVFLGS